MEKSALLLTGRFTPLLILTALITFLGMTSGSNEAKAQDTLMFRYTHTDEGDILVPKFDMTKAAGVEGVAVQTDDRYLHKFFDKVIGSILPESKRETLHLPSAVMVAFNRQGIVLNCKFFISSEDRKKITEEELFRIYNRLKQMQINPYKIKIAPAPETGNAQPDYAVISGSLISKSGRERYAKELEEQRLNNR